MQLMFDKTSVETAVKQPAPDDVPDYMLVRLLRLIFYNKNITLEDFSRCYTDYGKRLNWKPNEIRVRHYNDRKALIFSNKLTIFLFIRIILNVVGVNIESFEIVARNTVTGERVTYSSNEPVI